MTNKALYLQCKALPVHALVFILTYPLLLLISLLPHPLFYGLSNGVCWLVRDVFRYRRKMIANNVALALPNRSAEEQRKIVNAFYQHMCDVFLEIIKGISLSNKQILKRFVPKNIEALTTFEKQNRSTIIICGHYSSWEWMLSLGLRLENTPYGIYTPLSNPYFDRLIRRLRTRYKAALISRYKAVATIAEHQKTGTLGHYGFASDQAPKPKAKTYWRSFMGVEVPVFTGAERIAKEYDIPVVFADIQRVKRGYYEVELEVITAAPKEMKENAITDRFFELLEAQIQRDPTQYLWSHNRFKHSR
jgi:KDO2-lipid IV(A) lauroyltransferase